MCLLVESFFSSQLSILQYLEWVKFYNYLIKGFKSNIILTKFDVWAFIMTSYNDFKI